MEKYPNVSVKIVFRYKNEILMIGHKNGAVDFPGGRVKWGESLLNALNRELKEELSYSLEKEPKLFNVWSYVSKKQETS